MAFDEDDKPAHGPGVSFAGSIAVRKILKSCGLAVTNVEVYKHRSCVWVASTNKGQRWVGWKDGSGWKISKTPPTRKRTRPEGAP